jgi:hypothetical protein
MQQFASLPQHFLVDNAWKDKTEHQMNRMSKTPAPLKAINPAELYYGETSVQKPAKPQPVLSPIELMYAYYDAA